MYWIDFDPSIGGEIQKIRPALIISNNAANRAMNRVIVVPLTSQISRVYPGEVLVELNGQRRKAMADQIATVSKLRIKGPLGNLSHEQMAKVEQAILLHLAIHP